MIQVNNLYKTFKSKDKNIIALDNVSLNVEKQDIFGIIGQSGAGKSTLIRCLNLLENPDKGEIHIGEDNLLEMNKKDLRNKRKKIGMIFQNFNLFSSRTVYENIAYPLTKEERVEKKNKIDNLLKLVGLEERKNSYPNQLSGGQKQRVAIARALVNDPDILLSDEATSALDPETTKSVLELLKKINIELGVTIVLITHEMEVIKAICNKTAIMKDGKIIDSGKIEDVFSRSQYLLKNDNFDQSKFSISEGGILLKLHFKDSTAQLPIISQISREFDIDANILHGNIEMIGKQQFGTLIINLSGNEKNEALIYLQNKIEVEVL